MAPAAASTSRDVNSEKADRRYAASQRRRLGTFRMPGAGFFPLALGLILGLLSVLLWGTRIVGPVDGSTDARPERREVLYLIGSVAAAVGLFEPLGFLFTMTLFLALTMRVLGKINWPKSIVLNGVPITLAVGTG
jgi:hypothetical protein